MGGENQSYDDIELKENDGSVTSRHVQWVFMENGNGVCSDSESIESTNLDEDSSSLLSSSASEVMVEEEDDASSSSSSSSTSSSSSSSPTSSGPLYDLSELMDQLPIKRGLSNYYQGKSQSFTSLASVKSLEDLAKKASPYRKRMKPCKKYFSPKAIITKKSFSSSRGSSFVSSPGKNRATFVGTTAANSCRPSISVVQKQF